MADPFLAEIVMFAGNFAPRGWALCDGQLLPIAQNSALFSILGTTYGGDGRSNFALPDLRSRVAVHAGSGPGLTPRNLGSKGGTETNTLNQSNMAANFPNIAVHDGTANQTSPSNHLIAEPIDENGAALAGFSDAGATGDSLSGVGKGSGTPVNNVQPFQTVNFIIALTGVFPSRN